jgi:hypothetical protein
MHFSIKKEAVLSVWGMKGQTPQIKAKAIAGFIVDRFTDIALFGTTPRIGLHFISALQSGPL